MNIRVGSLIESGASAVTVLCLALGLALVGYHFHVSARPTAAAHAAGDLWVDAVDGQDTNSGLSRSAPFRTIQKAASQADPGTTVHILPGIYRESVRPAASGVADAPITYVAEAGPGTVVLRGSEPSSSLVWGRASGELPDLPDGVDPSNIYYADLSAWGLDEGPRFVVQLNERGEVAARFPLAREPDWHVETDWRYHELWWTADGGCEVAQCDPSVDPDWECDLPSRCHYQLTDVSHFPEPDPRIEAGDLTTMGVLSGTTSDATDGATLVALDAKWGHYVYRRRILSHDATMGRIEVEGECLQDGGWSDPGLGWGSKYYVEEHPALLDSPGEWWYDRATGRLYLWPPGGGDPAAMDIEISRWADGFDFTDRSFITLDGLTIEIVNRNAVMHGWGHDSHQGNTIRNSTLRYADFGVVVLQSGGGVTRDFRLEDSEIAYIDTNGLFISEWWDGAPSPDANWTPSTRDIVIKGNEMHHLGFRSDTDNAIGVKIQFANQLRFEENHVHDVAHNGVQFLWSVIDSGKTHDFSPDEIKTGGILVKDNLIEDTCQLTTDCAALKFWGQPPDNHVFRDVLVTGNIFRDNLAWSYVAEQRVGWWMGGESCDVQGQAGFGLYLDYASGIHAYRNIAYNNAYAGFVLVGTWRDGDVLLYNNVAANSLYGFRPSGTVDDTHGGSVNTQIVSNAIVSNEGYGIYQCTANEAFGNLTIDHNLYYNNGWRAEADGGVPRPGAMAIRVEGESQQYYQTLAQIQQHPQRWELHGAEGDPGFVRYDPDDHYLIDGSWPDFHVTPSSHRLVDRGAALPDSLTKLLSAFGVADPQWGTAWDIGRHEGSFVVSPSPPTQSIGPGGTVTYTLSVECVGECYSPVRVDAETPDPSFEVSIDPTTVTSNGEVALTVTDTGGEASGHYRVPVTAVGGGFTHGVSVDLFAFRSQVHLPLIIKTLP